MSTAVVTTAVTTGASGAAVVGPRRALSADSNLKQNFYLRRHNNKLKNTNITGKKIDDDDDVSACRSVCPRSTYLFSVFEILFRSKFIFI